MVTIVDEAPLVNDFLYYCVASGPSFAAGRKPSSLSVVLFCSRRSRRSFDTV